MSVLRYTLEEPLSESAVEYIDDTLRRSYATDNVEISDSAIEVGTDGTTSAERFTEVVGNLIYVSRSLNRKVLYESAERHAYSDDPMKPLLESRDVIRTADGMFSFQGQFWQVLKALKQHVFEISERHAAIEQEYPVLWPVDLYKRINYFREFPQQIIMASPLEGDFSKRDKFADKYDKGATYDSVSMQDGFAPATYGLQCAVCDTCYYNLRGTSEHPNTTYTTYNKVFRNETSSTGSLDRLLTFSVRDIMFVGDQDYVLLMRQKMLDEATELLAALGIESRIETANDPFFSNDSVVKNLFQNSSSLKYELVARVNYQDKFIAVGSVNLHLDFFGQAFAITGKDKQPAYSGCLGIGFERLAFVLYAQYGPNINEWPASVRTLLGL